MKRNLLITLDQSAQNHNIIFINDINKIVNHSCDSIEISLLEYLEEKNHNIVVKTLIDKLRPSGKLIIRISNAINIADQFVSYQISSKDFLSFFENKQSILCLDTLYAILDPNVVSVIETDIASDYITIILERISI